MEVTKTRYFMELAYNGKSFNGWQIQPNAPSVQQELETALSTILRENINIVGCGRTDAGVHAKIFYAHFDTSQPIDAATVLFKMNCLISFDIAVYKIFPVSESFHARFSATSRTYHYFINQRKNPFEYESSWYMHQTLHMDLMNKACSHLIGKKDFTSFSKLHTQTKTNMCTVKDARWEVFGNQLRFSITADRFLRNMVRAVVGTLVEIGREKLTISDFEEIIASKSRQNAGASVPAHGLFLVDVKYPNFEV